MNYGRKISGGRNVKRQKKKKYERAGQKRIVELEEKEKRKTKTTRGGKRKVFLLKAKFVNVINKKGKVKKATIKNVLETPSNKFLARQNVITKGTIVQIDIGKVKITNRPSQEGTLNGVLIE